MQFTPSQVAKKLRALPSLEVGLPTLALVGAPNVGKSSLVQVGASLVGCRWVFKGLEWVEFLQIWESFCRLKRVFADWGEFGECGGKKVQGWPAARGERLCFHAVLPLFLMKTIIPRFHNAHPRLARAPNDPISQDCHGFSLSFLTGAIFRHFARP